jgi:hypothetical protein
MKPSHRGTQGTIDSLAETLLPISRVLVQSNQGAGTLVFAAKLAYLRAAIEAVPLRGVRLNISRLSVATGMTRKEVSSLLRYTATYKGTALRTGPEQRAFRVVRGWMTDPRFKTRNGRPAQLPLRGGGPDFSTLVRTYGGDVTLASVLGELERTKAVQITEQGKVRLKRFRGCFGAQPLGGLSEFALLLSDFVNTTSQVINDKKSPIFFGFQDCMLDSDAQTSSFQRAFARRGAALLASMNQWRARHRALPKSIGQKSRRSPARVGLGVYLVHNDSTEVVSDSRRVRR